jgi:hypothetical protein
MTNRTLKLLVSGRELSSYKLTAALTHRHIEVKVWLRKTSMLVKLKKSKLILQEKSRNVPY